MVHCKVELEASVSSRMPLLQQMNYVLITSDDFQAFARNPHGLMELGFRDPQLHTTVLPHLINMPTLRTFLAPLWASMQTSLTVRASLNGIALDHQLVATESGFYPRVHIWCHRLSTWPGRTHNSCAPTPDDFHGWLHPQSWNYGLHTWRQ